MAIIFDFAQDWTYDLFMEDVNKYNATPMHGVYPNPNSSDREKFMTWLKGLARDYMLDWNKDHKGLYDRYDGYIGDLFKEELVLNNFSDRYKDVYGQRPHLSYWFYIHVIGLPMQEDIARTFCATPVDDAIDEAIYNRNLYSAY